MDLKNNHYARLGIPIDATPEEIRWAYREAARRLHPDSNPNPGATELFLKIQESYDIISDPQKRAEYDRTLPEGFTIPPPIAIGVQYSRSTLPQITESQVIYVLLNMQARPDPDTRVSPPLNVCLVLDVSTSMQGPYLDTVKNTAIQLVRQLKTDDSLALVSFSDKAAILLPAGRSQDRSSIEFQVRMLQTSGGTEIYQGLAAGFSEVQRLLSKDTVNHLILLTDGRTYGDEAECIRIANEAAELGIGISTLGIGNKWNDTFLDHLASITGGNSTYVSRPGDITSFLQEKFSGFATSYANRVTFSFNPAPQVELRYAFRLQPDVSLLEIQPPIQLGRVPLSTGLSVLFEFCIPKLTEHIGDLTLAEGHLTFDIPSRFIPTFTTRLRVDRPISVELLLETPPDEIVQALSKLTLYRLQEKAHLDLETGNIDAATRRLQYLVTHLLSQGERELANTVMGEAIHVQQNKRFSEEGNKRIKYGTRALLLPASQRTGTSPFSKQGEQKVDGGEGGKS
jgi:Ca-activated chloride channel homolog